MTPTLAMVVMRDAEIAAFVPKPFYTVQLGMDGITAASRRFDDKEDAQEVLAKCKESMKAMVKSMDRKEKTEHAPLLYDLTSLQRDANCILGFTAQQTLNYIQALYEKKLVTYPRTYSRYLTEDMKPMLPALITQVAKKSGPMLPPGRPTTAQNFPWMECVTVERSATTMPLFRPEPCVRWIWRLSIPEKRRSCN